MSQVFDIGDWNEIIKQNFAKEKELILI